MRREDVGGRPIEPRKLDLDLFFRPRSVAVVGASDTPRRPNTAMYEKIRKWARAAGATVYPINPTRAEVGGVRCYPSLYDVAEGIDLVAVLVGDPIPIIREAIERKAKFAVVFAAGFAEVGAEGERLQAELASIISTSDLHVLGPNTNLNAFESFREDLPGKSIALITQSGHQGRPIFQGQELGIRLSHWAPTGNEVDLEVADFMTYFADQPDVGAIACYVEGFKDGRSLMLAADHAAKRGVPVVAVKVGRTSAGREMAKAHTGHLAGSDAVVSGVFRQFGILRVDCLDELLDVSAALARSPLASTAQHRAGAKPRHRRLHRGVCVYSISGGTGAHMADLVAAAGLGLPKLSRATQEQLHEWIPPYLSVSNPVDNGGAPSADWRGRKILDAIVADPAVELLICPITGALASMGNRLAKDLVDVSATTPKPVFVVWGSPVGDETAYREVLLKSDVPCFRTFSNAVLAAKAWFDHAEHVRSYRSGFDSAAMRRSPGSAAARRILAAGSHRGALAQESASGFVLEQGLSEHSSKQLLAAYGIPVTREEVCTTRSEALSAARRIGYPVVMKAASSELSHKSDLGLVAVGVSSDAAVRSTYGRLLERASAELGGGAPEGVLVCEQVAGGVETVLGIARDELFGPVVMLGMGGVLVELLDDVAFRVPPFPLSEARRMIFELKGSRLLQGYRGAPKADIGALASCIMKVQHMALDLADELVELDVNPLCVTHDTAVALDALAVSRRSTSNASAR
ncbi:MAG: acetate--CoA ligase family protein [Actinomycetota bacterium]|nr:acetate--CoA ligase family protein [Actinomycetota bacterium]